MDGLLVTGATGLIGEAVRGQCDPVAWWHRHPAPTGQSVDLCDARAVEAAWRRTEPAVVLHLAALSRIADCERDPGRARALNVEATDQLVRLADATGSRVLLASTDLVFEGATGAPFAEDVTPSPRTTYARTKREAEDVVLRSPGRHLVCRIALCYGPCRGALRQLDWILDRARAGLPVDLYTDERRSPIDSPRLAEALLELAASEATGVVHLGGARAVDRLTFGQALLERAGFDPALARPAISTDSPVPRPGDVALDTTRANRLLSRPLDGLESGLRRVFA